MKKLKTFEDGDLKVLESRINEFAEKVGDMKGQIYPVVVDGMVYHYGYYWFDEIQDSQPVITNGELNLDVSSWKDDKPQNFWTRKDGIEQRLAMGKDGRWYYNRVQNGKKVWGDVLEIDEKKKKAKIRMR